MTDVAEIARGLGPNAKQIVRLLSGEFAPKPIGVTRQLVASVVTRNAGLFEREWQDGCAQCTYYRLTPLGIAVRDYLKGQEDE